MLDRLKRWNRQRPVPVGRDCIADPETVRAFFDSLPLYGPVDLARVQEHQSSVTPSDILRSANAALRHEFDLLGSGPFVPIAAEPAAGGGYRRIDWALDPVTGQRFPNNLPSESCSIGAICPPRSDIKRPWELARCYHWITLAQGWLLTRRDAYAEELLDQCDDFMEGNPVGTGIHWICTMDVAIRATNWALALQRVRDASIEEARWARAVGSLVAHGRFIRSHLENHYEVTSNHFLSNVVGLMAVARVLPQHVEASEWLTFSTAAVEQEIGIQVLDDGADFESSVPYHRLVTELFFAAARMADAAGAPLSTSFRARLRLMHEFMAALLRPDGLMPQIGDADDGRLHVFRGHDRQVPQDPRHLFGPAAAMFGDRRFAELGGPEAVWDAAWWGLEVPTTAARIPPIDAFFQDAGIAIRRDSAGGYLAVTNGAVGTRGFGNHKHNDLLSFEYHVGAHPIIVDPGSFVYTSDPEARNTMRSVVSHNTIAPEGVEQNTFNPEWLFRMFERASPEHLDYHAEPMLFRYAGRHRGYAELGLVVSRLFMWKPDVLEIRDTVDGDPERPVALQWRFHLAPDVDATIVDGSVRIAVGDVAVVLSCSDSLQLAVQPAWYSPSYGVRRASHQVVAHGTIDSLSERNWIFRLQTRKVQPA